MENLIKNNEKLLTEITKNTNLINKNLASMMEKIKPSNDKLTYAELEKIKTHINNYIIFIDAMNGYKKLCQVFIKILKTIERE